MSSSAWTAPKARGRVAQRYIQPPGNIQVFGLARLSLNIVGQAAEIALAQGQKPSGRALASDLSPGVDEVGEGGEANIRVVFVFFPVIADIHHAAHAIAIARGKTAGVDIQ